MLASPVERNRTVQSRNPIMADLISMVFIAHPLYATESDWQVWGGKKARPFYIASAGVVFKLVAL